MTRKRPRERKQQAAQVARPEVGKRNGNTVRSRSREVSVMIAAALLVVLGVGGIYWQTVQVPTINYEDPFYLVNSSYVHSAAPLSRLSAVWNEPYFANFHPVTTTTWLLDRALADKTKPFDALPFRMTHLAYAAIGAVLLILLYRQLGIPMIFAGAGAVLYAVHPVHTEVVAWLSARKDLISLIFVVLAFLAWLWAGTSATSNQWRIRYSLTVLLVLLAVLSKPVAVILPALFIAYEFCSQPHGSLREWSWSKRKMQPLLSRTLAMAAMFLVLGGFSTLVFRALVLRDPMHGGWPIFVPLVLMLLMLPLAPPAPELEACRRGSAIGIRILAPIAILSVVFGAGAAWTVWAQQQVGAIKGGLTLMPTVNLMFETLLGYLGKTFVPAGMSVSYTWSEYPNLNAAGLIGAVAVCALLWIAMRLAGAADRNQRLVAFGIFWYFIAFIPVSNLVPTSTKMADRYLFVPTVGGILAVLALCVGWTSVSRSRQLALCSAFLVVSVTFAAWSYRRTQVWCGTNTVWNGTPQPDLSLWTAAVDVDPDDVFALRNLALSYLHLVPPQADKALEHLNHALQTAEANQSRIAGDKVLVLSPIHEALGDGYITRASQLAADRVGSDIWQQKKTAYANAVQHLKLATDSPSGFAPMDARVLSRLSEASEGQAEMDDQEVASTKPENRDSLLRERDELRGRSEEAIRRAQAILTAGGVTTLDPNYRMVMIDLGNIPFGRAAWAANAQEKAADYQQALTQYQTAAALLPDDPRPVFYQGLCYERLTELAQSPEEKKAQFSLGQAAMTKASTLTVDIPDYNPALPYRGMASLYAHMSDFQSALTALRRAKQLDTTQSPDLDRDIRSLETYLAAQGKKP